MSSIRFTCFMFMVCFFLFCLINESCPFAQSALGKCLLGPSRTSLRVNKGLFVQHEVDRDFSEKGSKEVGAIAREMRNLLGGDSKMRSIREKREEGGDEKYPGFTGNTMKVGLNVRHRLRLRSKQKGKSRSDGGHAGGFVAFNADYHFPRQHPPRNN